jgi:septal ring factor EnvC (AmiA/AmiB activator)
MNRPTIKSLTEQLELETKREADERQKRYTLESKVSELKETVESLKDQLRSAEGGIEHWKAQLYRCQGHLTGMRETLLAAKLVENVDVKAVVYDTPSPEPNFLPRKLWPEFR